MANATRDIKLRLSPIHYLSENPTVPKNETEFTLSMLYEIMKAGQEHST